MKTKGPLDFEGTPNTYTLTVTVRATDPFAAFPRSGVPKTANSDEVMVEITVTAVNEPPAVDGE